MSFSSRPSVAISQQPLVISYHTQEQYVGETDRTLQSRLSEHRGYVINNHFNKATRGTFQPERSHFGRHIALLENIYSTDGMVRKEREAMYIK